MLYRHLDTGVTAELIETKELAVKMKVVETGEIKEVWSSTFKRWWKAVEAETGPAEAQDAPEESRDVPGEPETPKAEESKPEEKEAPAGDEETPLALSEIVSKLENLFDLLNKLNFGGKLPRPIITVQSSPRFFGHCSTKKIWKAGSEGEGEGRYEINIGAEFLNRPSEYTAATMLHEMVHLYCCENGLEETCQNGRYHNRLFKQECEAHGLTIEYNRTIGYSISLPSEPFVESLRANGFAFKVPFARRTLEREKKKAEREKSHKYFCPACGQEVRTVQELSLICGICEIPMERAD
jgi:hypothetical protein